MGELGEGAGRGGERGQKTTTSAHDHPSEATKRDNAPVMTCTFLPDRPCDTAHSCKKEHWWIRNNMMDAKTGACVSLMQTFQKEIVTSLL